MVKNMSFLRLVLSEIARIATKVKWMVFRFLISAPRIPMSNETALGMSGFRKPSYCQGLRLIKQCDKRVAKVMLKVMSILLFSRFPISFVCSRCAVFLKFLDRYSFNELFVYSVHCRIDSYGKISYYLKAYIAVY